MTVVPLDTGRESGAVISHTNITARKEAEEALRASEERYRLLADHAEDFVALLDAQENRLYISPSFFRVTGWSPEEVMRAPWDARLHPDDIPLIQQSRAANRAGQTTVIEHRIRCRDGSWMWAEARCKPLLGSDGRMIQLLVWQHDITARKRADATVQELNRTLEQRVHERTAQLEGANEQLKAEIGGRKQAEVSLRRSEANLQIAFDAAQLGPWHWDILTGKLTWSAKCRALYGLASDADVTMEVFLRAIHPEDRERVRATLHNAVENRAEYIVEKRILRPDRSVRWTASRGRCTYDDKGRALRMDGVSFDITERKQVEEELAQLNAELETRVQQRTAELAAEIAERKQAEAALRTSESALVMAQRMAQVGNWLWNPATDQTIWSEEMFRIFGRDPKLGAAGIKEVPKYFTPESWARVSGAVETSLVKGIPYECDAEVVRDDGTHRWITTRGEPVRAADGSIVGLRGSVQDITERKLAADQIHQLNQSLEQRVHERTAQLEASNRELESFCYSVSHDLRAPLRAINGFANILSREHAERLDDEGRRTLNIVCAEALRMGQLIDDLLEFSRIGRQSMQQAEIDMAAVAQRAFDECSALAPDRKVLFKLHRLPPALGDPALIPQVWINLISNAIKYTRPKAAAEIEITGRLADDELVYCVKDNGVGFDMQYADKLFGVFQRLHGETEFEGTGVGLALVQRIILRHGGRVCAESRLNEGAAFYFTLPAKKT